MECILQFAHRLLDELRLVFLGLVDGDHMGQFQNAFLDPLQRVAGSGQDQEKEEIDHIGDLNFGLAGAYRLDQDHVVAGSLAEDHGLARICRHTAQLPG